MIPYICLAILLACLCKQDMETKEHYVAGVAFWVYVFALLVLNTGIGEALYNANSYAYMSLFNLSVVGLLFYRFGNLAILLMGLNILSIIANTLGFWMEETTGTTALHESIVLFLFSVEVCFLLSKRIADGVYRGVGECFILLWGADSRHKDNSSGDKG